MRVKRGVAAHKRHKKLLKQTKGMKHVRRASPRMARQAIFKSLSYAYRDRRNRKRDFRSLWITRINAGAHENGLSYSTLMAALKKSEVKLDRKILSELASRHPKVFKTVVETVKDAPKVTTK